MCWCRREFSFSAGRFAYLHFVRHFHSRLVFFIPVFARAFSTAAPLATFRLSGNNSVNMDWSAVIFARYAALEVWYFLLIGKTSALSLVPLWSSNLHTKSGTFYERENQHAKSGGRAWDTDRGHSTGQPSTTRANKQLSSTRQAFSSSHWTTSTCRQQNYYQIDSQTINP